MNCIFIMFIMELRQLTLNYCKNITRPVVNSVQKRIMKILD